jgi:hypothetical protein
MNSIARVKMNDPNKPPLNLELLLDQYNVPSGHQTTTATNPTQ